MGIGDMFAQEEVPMSHEPEGNLQSGTQKAPNQLPNIIFALYDKTSKTFEFSGSYLYPIPYCVYNENGNVIQSGVCVKDNCAYTIDLCNIPPCQISIEIMIQGVLFMGSFQV